MKHDPVYSTVYCLTLRDWPEHRKQVPQITRHFWGTWDELSIDASLFLKGTSGCILEMLNHTLADLYAVHQGINRMQIQAREAVYWTSIDADIVHSCTICTKHKASPCTANAS